MSAEYIANLNLSQRVKLTQWLMNPNGALTLGRSTFESVDNGGVMIRVRQWGSEIDNVVQY